ncbi:hypothetical protein D9M70_501510 [compost metagenome]
MRLEALELLEREEIGVLVVEVHDEADGDQVVFEVVEERAATGLHAKRPAERVLHQARSMVFRLHLPEFLQADAEFLDAAVLREVEFGDQLLGERTAHAFADQRVFAQERHATGEVRSRFAIALDAHVAGGNADDGTFVVIEHFGRGKARIDLDTQGFRMACQPATDIAERDDIVAVIVHQRRHHEIRQAD